MAPPTITKDTEAPSRHPSGRRRLWFPPLWTGLIGAVLAVCWLGDFDREDRNFVTVIAYPIFFAGLSLWVVRSSGLNQTRRWIVALAPWVLLLAISPWGPVRLIANGNIGIVGWQWRWTPAPDERLEAVGRKANSAIAWNTTPDDYPAFLGGRYWAEVGNVEIDVQRIAEEPPPPLWKKSIGAGWSGFAIVGNYAVTQEQRGRQELVTCYHLRTGELVWSHADNVRFDPSGTGALGGIGPRATPTIHRGRVYTHGATGIVNSLDASTGELLWSRKTAVEFSTANLLWGKSTSPLVVDGMLIVAVGGEGCSVVAYDCETGLLRWAAGDRRASYASPIATKINGVRQVLSIDEGCLSARRLEDGARLWQHPWPFDSEANPAASNPVPTTEGRVLLSKGYGVGAELIEVAERKNRWVVATVWKKPVLKTKMSNVLVKEGYVYGIDDVHLSCVALDTGRRQWKKRRRPQVGDGQIMLVGDHILVLSESGEIILVAADPKEYREAASFQAIEGLTWNNPAFSGNHLLVRNASEAACFKLPILDEAELAPTNLDREDGVDPDLSSLPSF